MFLSPWGRSGGLPLRTTHSRILIVVEAVIAVIIVVAVVATVVAHVVVGGIVSGRP